MSENKLIGGCACGAVRYESTAEPVIVAHCHCRDCQRLSGAGHATGAMFPEAQVRISGAPGRFTLTSDAGNTVTRLFCGACGSPLFGMNTGMPGFMTVAAGTLDEPDRITPEVVVFARSRPHWDAMDAALPTFDDQPPWKPGAG